MKTRIIVYGLLAVVIAVTAYYVVIKEKMPTGRGTGMGVSYSYDGFGNIQTGKARLSNKSLSELRMQKGKVRGIRTSDSSDDYRVDFEYKEERYVSISPYGIHPDSKVIPLVLLAYQTKSECMIGLDGGTIVYIMLDQGYQDQTTLMMKKLEEINKTTQAIGNYVRYIWYYVYNIYRRIR